MKRAQVIHPFFFAAFPALALYAHNFKSLPIPLREVAGPLALSLVGSGLIFVLIRAVIKDTLKSGLLTTLVLFWFFSFGHIAGRIADWTGGLYIRSFLFATAILIGLIAVAIVRSKRSYRALTGFFNVAGVALVVFNLASLGQTLALRSHVVESGAGKSSEQLTIRPNIYYIVLDAYTRADILREVFSFDNDGFLSELRARGFYVASNSYANYGLTYNSLASSLNMTYLDDLAHEVGSSSPNQKPLFRMILENRVMAFLRSQGYRLFGSSLIIRPGEMKEIDQFLGFSEAPSEFRPALLNTTPLPLLFDFSAGRSTYDGYRRYILDVFRYLRDSPRLKGPSFFFVHLMAPHPPFVFGPNGESVDPGYAFSIRDSDYLHGGQESNIQKYVHGYSDQVAFLNTKVLEVIDSILSRSSEPPIIILQGDHGSRAYTDLDHPEASYLRENLAILNAYFLPGDHGHLLYPEISPVNSFRLVFKHYFGADLELLEDRSAWCTWRHPFRFLPFDDESYSVTLDSLRAR